MARSASLAASCKLATMTNSSVRPGPTHRTSVLCVGLRFHTVRTDRLRNTKAALSEPAYARQMTPVCSRSLAIQNFSIMVASPSLRPNSTRSIEVSPITSMQPVSRCSIRSWATASLPPWCRKPTSRYRSRPCMLICTVSTSRPTNSPIRSSWCATSRATGTTACSATKSFRGSKSGSLLDLGRDGAELLQEIARTMQPLFRRVPLGVIDELVIGPELHAGAFLLDEGDEAFGVGEMIVAEGEDRALRTGIDLRHASLATEPLDLDDIEEVPHFFRHSTEALDQLGGETLDGLVAVGRREAPIKTQPDLQVRHVGFRNEDRGPEMDPGRPLILDHRPLAALERGHGLFQHRLVKLEANFPDMACVLVAQESSCAPDIKIVAGEDEAGAERVQGLQHLQPLLGGWTES